jgi:putative membrane protein
MEVLSDHLMQIRLAERARKDARSAETRRFAERLLEDFSRYQDRWEKLADRYDLKAPKGLGKLHEQKVQRLEKASKGNFDRTYAAIVAENLGSIVPYFQKEGNAVRVASVRRLVDDELPVIREHLNRARQLENQASARADRDDRN